MRADLKNQIYEIFITNYYLTEQNIIKLFENNHYSQYEDIYIILNIFLTRFHNYKTQHITQLNFNDYYKTIFYTNNMSYNNDNYNYLFSNYQSNYSNPVDILNIFGYIGYKMLNDSIKNNPLSV